MPLHEPPERALSRVLQGVALRDLQSERDGYRHVLRAGAAAVPVIEAKLDVKTWSQAPKGPTRTYLAVLLAMLDAVDPAAFRAAIDRLGRTKLHPAHRHTLRIMARRRADTPQGDLSGVPVFVAEDVAQRDQALDLLHRWHRPFAPLNDISRIDIIARRDDMDCLGRYRIASSGIVLCWPTAPPKGRAARWFWDFQAQHTFYHALGHLEGGQVAEQEVEANAFAARLMRRARPGLTAIATPFLVAIWLNRKLRPRN